MILRVGTQHGWLLKEMLKELEREIATMRTVEVTSMHGSVMSITEEEVKKAVEKLERRIPAYGQRFRYKNTCGEGTTYVRPSAKTEQSLRSSMFTNYPFYGVGIGRASEGATFGFSQEDFDDHITLLEEE